MCNPKSVKFAVAMFLSLINSFSITWPYFGYTYITHKLILITDSSTNVFFSFFISSKMPSINDIILHENGALISDKFQRIEFAD